MCFFLCFLKRTRICEWTKKINSLNARSPDNSGVDELHAPRKLFDPSLGSELDGFTPIEDEDSEYGIKPETKSSEIEVDQNSMKPLSASSPIFGDISLQGEPVFMIGGKSGNVGEIDSNLYHSKPPASVPKQPLGLPSDPKPEDSEMHDQNFEEEDSEDEENSIVASNMEIENNDSEHEH